VTVPYGRVPPPWWTANVDDTGPLPHDPTSETTRLIRVAHASAKRRYEEADAVAEAIIDQARQEAHELLHRAEADAELQRNQARRVLADAQEQAAELVAEAEQRARRVLSGARQDALNHAGQVSRTLEARANEVIEAERATLRRLHDARRALSVLIEALAGADPVLGPTVEILQLAVDARMNAEPPPTAGTDAGAAVAADPSGDGHAGHDHDPAAPMVRSAVARAMEAACAPAGADAPDGYPPVSNILSEITDLVTAITDEQPAPSGPLRPDVT
jgi:vacuolar-type H+-ATPase subunit H